MRIIRTGLLSVAAVLVFNACNSVSQTVLVNAFAAAKLGDLAGFKERLEGDALQTFGTPEGMARIQSALAHWDSFTASESIVREYSVHGWHHTVYREEIYGQTAGTAPVMIGVAQVECANIRVWYCAIEQLELN